MDDYDALSQKQSASLKRDTRISLEDAAVRATHKVMAELGEEHMTFQEQIKALPEAERTKFFRGLMAVAEAGRLAGVPPEELAKMYFGVYNEVEKNT